MSRFLFFQMSVLTLIFHKFRQFCIDAESLPDPVNHPQIASVGWLVGGSIMDVDNFGACFGRKM